jgi:uncharacterized protein
LLLAKASDLKSIPNHTGVHFDPPDLFVIELAALFHDIHDEKYESVNSADGIDLQSWTSQHGVSERQSSLIAAIVSNVSYSKEVKRRGTSAWTEWHDTCIELHCVMDADKLDALGAFGIFRCAAFSSGRNIRLFLRADEDGFKCSAVGHFHDKLFRLESMMMTQTGRKVARKRTALMRDFIEHLNDEAQLRDFKE